MYKYTPKSIFMATIQSKKSKGHKYWYIVESRRVNGKPRPIVLAYLGKAEDLLERLNQSVESLKLKSYSHRVPNEKSPMHRGRVRLYTAVL